MKAKKKPTAPRSRPRAKRRAGPPPARAETPAPDFQAMLDDQTELVSRFHADGTLTYVNEGYCRYFGRRREQLVGSKWHPRAVAADLPLIRRELARLSRRHPVVVIENRVIDGAGEARWVQFVNRAFFDRRGRLVETQSVGRDITHWKLVEEALRESEARWQFAVEGVGEGVWDWDVRTSRVIFSRQWKRMIGHEEDEIGDSFEEWRGRVHPDDLPCAEAAVKELIEGRTPAYAAEFRMRCKDGSWKWIQARGVATSRDGKGRPLRVIGRHADITERKTARLREDTNLRLVAEGAPSAAVLEAIVRSVEAEHPGVRCCVMLAGPGGGHLLVAAAPGLPEFFRRALRGLVVAPDMTTAGAVMCAGARVITEDIQVDASWEPLAKLAARARLRSCWAEPVLGSAGQIAGVFMCCHRVARAPSAHEIATVSAAAHLAAVALEREAADRALRDSEARYRSIMESKLTGLIFWRLDGTITDANDTFLEMVGCTREDLRAGRVDWKAMTPPEFRARDKQAVAEMKAKGHIAPFEKEYVRPDGTRVPVMLGGALFPHRADEGVSFVIDITDRKRAERALVESEERYRLLADHSDDIVGLNNTHGNRLYVSPSYFRKTGWTPDDMRKPNWRLPHHPDDVATVARARAANIAGEATRIEHRVGCADGSWLWLDTSCKPVFDAGGRVWRLLVWSHDINARKKAEAAHRRELEFSKALLSHTAALILVTDVQGRIEHVNPVFSQVLGHEVADIKGRRASDIGLMDAHEQRRWDERFERLAAGEETPPAEVHLLARDGGTRVLEAWGAAARDHEGRIERIVVTFMDMTECNRLRNEVLRIAEQEHARIGNDLHDGVGQTMTGIASLLEALEAGLEGRARDLAGRIRELVQESVAEVRRMCHGLSPAGVRNRGLGGGLLLLGETIRTNYRAACRCEIDAAVKIDDEETATHLFRIAQEAVHNAMRHGKPGLITIALRRLDTRECELRIEDDGAGFKADKRGAQSEGIGVRVMDYRARIIHGTLAVGPRRGGGVVVTCRFPCAACGDEIVPRRADG